MQIRTELTKHQTHYLINLLNNDYTKMRRTKEELLKIDLDFINEKCCKTKMLMIERLEKTMEENETICHKLDDHLTDIGRGYKLTADTAFGYGEKDG